MAAFPALAPPLVTEVPAASIGSLRALDGRLAAGGVVTVRTGSESAILALMTYVCRRISAQGHRVVSSRAVSGASIFRELEAWLGIPPLEADPGRAATDLAAWGAQHRTAIVIEAPRAGSWDAQVLTDLRAHARSLVVVIEQGRETIEAVDTVDAAVFVPGTLDDEEKAHWLATLAEDTHDAASVRETSDLADLEAWWSEAKRAGAAAPSVEDLTEADRDAMALLALVDRAWPRAQLGALWPDATESLVRLQQAGAVSLARGRLTLHARWTAVASAWASTADATLRSRARDALTGTFPGDAWAFARAADLVLPVDAPAADRHLARALELATGPAARRELATRWYERVSALSPAVQAPLRLRGAERALAVGESEEAYRWARGAAGANDDADLLLILGRAAVGVGDLVGAGVSLARCQRIAKDPAIRAEATCELAEIAYQGGDLARACDLGREVLGAAALAETVRLRARNTLGKILLAEGRWNDADVHFEEDAMAAASVADVTSELRARLNRGIALLSKGLMDDAASMFRQVLRDGEASGSTRAQAFALSNLAVIALRKGDLGEALGLLERCVAIRQQLGDRLRLVQDLCNLAELRLLLGLVDHADHAIRFARRAAGPGMPAARSTQIARLSACVALARRNTHDARREISQAIVDGLAAQDSELLTKAHVVSARVALEDGDVKRAMADTALVRRLGTTASSAAEAAVLDLLVARAAGLPDGESVRASELALAAIESAKDARGSDAHCSDDELLREVHGLLCILHTDRGDIDSARVHHDRATALREHVALGLEGAVRAAFLAKRRPCCEGPERPPRARLVGGHHVGDEGEEEGPRTQRSSSLPPARGRREIAGNDPAIRSLLAAVKKVARASSTVLVHGESGTGKELIAEALHAASDRASGPLVTVNCAALVETLLLSELFGHEKGAFTGAGSRRRGRFELAENGTLFLDEIGDISPRTQVALLRVLQEKTFERVGSTTPIHCNVRIVCATHRDLKAMVERGEFRDDLYYRLRGITLEVPPLRARTGDIPRIAEELLARIAEERGESPRRLSQDAVALLARHRWPGNVRELENVLRAVTLFVDRELIHAADLVDNVDDMRTVPGPAARGQVATPSAPPPAPPSRGPGSLACDLPGDDDEAIASLPQDEAHATAIAYAQVRQGALSLADMKRQIERDCIARALAETRGNITKAASLLGMKRPRLSQLVKQYGLTAAALVSLVGIDPSEVS